MFSQTRANFLHTIRENSKIISYGNKITTLILVGLIGFTNCQKDKGNQNSFLFAALLGQTTQTTEFKLNARLQDSNSGSLSNATFSSTSVGFGETVVSVFNENVQGLFINELTANAFDYRPGEQEQEIDPINRVNAPDWSPWMIAAPPGTIIDSRGDYNFSPEFYEKATNNVLEVGGRTRPDWYQSFGISGKRDFEIDALSLTIEAPGLVYNNQYIGTLWHGTEDPTKLSGPNGKHPLYKYQQWSETETYHTYLEFPGFHHVNDVPGHTFVNSNDITVLFIRNDILTAPATLQMTAEGFDGGKYSNIGYTSRTLTTAENDFVLSLLRQNQPLMYHWNLVLIPFEGPITIAFDGETNEAEKRFLWNEVDVQIDLDVSNILDTDPLKSDLTNLQHPILTVKGDENHVPFGINMKVVKKESDGVSKLLTKR
ncbi:hypothetical protein AB3N59_02170 [Leptospira sp. WS92.C1]